MGKIENFVNQSLRSCIDVSRQLRFNKDIAQQLYAICVYSTILEIASDTLNLIKNRSKISTAILLRSLLEAYVDLLNIIKDENYLQNMYVSALDGKMRMINDALKSNSSLFVLFHQHHNLSLKRIEELKKLKPKGYKKLRIRERFKFAGLEAEYCGIYALLCTQTHNDMDAIENRHIQVEGDTKSCSVKFFEELDSEGFLRYIYTLADIIINSSLRIHEFLKSSRLEVLKEIRSKYQTLESL